MISKDNEKNDSYKWVVLAISFMLMLTFAISLQSLPPLFDKIVKDIYFSNSQAGMLMSAYAIPGIFLSYQRKKIMRTQMYHQKNLQVDCSLM